MGGQGDKGTRGQGDKGTRGQGDKGTRGWGDIVNCQLSTVHCQLTNCLLVYSKATFAVKSC